MRILLTGAAGQLGRRFRERSPWGVVPAFRSAAGDVEGGVVLPVEDAAACFEVLERVRPDWVVHAAAMTSVDSCERDPAAAEAANARGTENVARAAAAVGARMAYVSTDYVFDGARGSYRETDATGPINVYGATKLAGEERARAALPDVLIARTAVVFGPHKRNFVTWVVDELRAGRRVRLAKDQRVSPTSTTDLADQLIALIRADASGVYHTAGATALDRVEMAQAIARVFGLDASLIDPVRAEDLPWVARRPLDSTLDVSKVARHKAPLTFDAALRELRVQLDAPLRREA